MLHKMIDQSKEYDQSKFDAVAPARTFTFEGDLPGATKIVSSGDSLFGGVSTAGMVGKLTNTAFSQLCTKLGPAVFGKGSAKKLPQDYLQAIPSPLRAQVLNDHKNALNGNKWMVRYHQDSARAILSDNYSGGVNAEGLFENTAYMTVIQQLIDEQNEKNPGAYPNMHLVRSSVTPDDLNLRIVWKNVLPPDSDGRGGYGVGVAMVNGEIGNRKLGVYPLVQRTSCDNSIIAGGEGMEFIHRGSLASIRTQFKAAIGKALEVTGEIIDRIIEAEAEEIPDFDTILVGLSAKHDWSVETTLKVMNGTEGRKTRAGLVHGITYAAHTATEDPNLQVEMEMLGGHYLFAELPRVEGRRVIG